MHLEILDHQSIFKGPLVTHLMKDQPPSLKELIQ